MPIEPRVYINFQLGTQFKYYVECMSLVCLYIVYVYMLRVFLDEANHALFHSLCIENRITLMRVVCGW